jgi:hypothetical protein
MRRLIFALMLAAALFTNAARAQTFACQYVANGGLTWEKGKWGGKVRYTQTLLFKDARRKTHSGFGGSSLFCKRSRDKVCI